MNDHPSFLLVLRVVFSLNLALFLPNATAQTVSEKGSVATLKGTTFTGSPFDIKQLHGKVVMVFYWSTRCNVCLSHMPELRANLAGWRDKPFELVTVNVDSNMADWRHYEQIATQTQSKRPVTIWSDPIPVQKLPLTLVLDVRGQVMAKHEGRIATEAWDEVADLLP